MTCSEYGEELCQGDPIPSKFSHRPLPHLTISKWYIKASSLMIWHFSL